jgi:hypothetical protein
MDALNKNLYPGIWRKTVNGVTKGEEVLTERKRGFPQLLACGFVYPERIRQNLGRLSFNA